MTRALSLCIGLFASLTASAQAVPEAIDSLRAEFRAAFDAARAGAPPPDESAPLQAYILYPYLEAARLERALLGASGADTVDVATAEFLDRHDGLPVSRGLHRNWQRSLAARAQWATLRSVYRQELADDRLRCQYLAARIARDDVGGIAAEITTLWLTPAQLPIECEAVFQWLRDEGLLDQDLVEQRVRALLANGQGAFARVIARRLDGPRARPLLAWADLIEEPERTLDLWLTAGFPEIENTALLDGWSRLSRNRPAAALARAEAMMAAGAAGARPTSPYALALALGLAWDRRPEALDWFARTAVEEFDDEALGWLARAALWAGRWQLVADTINAMPTAQRASSAWRYWLARAEEQVGDTRRARDLYTATLPDDNYYSAMAATRLGRRPEPHPAPLGRHQALIDALRTQPNLLRAQELAAVGLRSEATLEWQDGYAALSSDEREQSIHVAASLGLYDIAVATATRHAVFADYALLYPRPYEREVDGAAKTAGLSAELIYALMRQESLYRPDAASARGALGLTQMQIGTARRTARVWQRPEPARSDLFDPHTSIELGALHLRELLERFGDRTAVALAAYNAGPEAAARWLPEQPLDADIWIENIPYNETRAYVRRTLWHSVVFEWLAQGRVARPRAWLEPIAAPESAQ